MTDAIEKRFQDLEKQLEEYKLATDRTLTKIAEAMRLLVDRSKEQRAIVEELIEKILISLESQSTEKPN